MILFEMRTQASVSMNQGSHATTIHVESFLHVLRRICIITDGQVAIKAISSVKTQSGTARECKSIPVAITKNNRVTLQCVSGHQGNLANDKMESHSKLGGAESICRIVYRCTMSTIKN